MNKVIKFNRNKKGSFLKGNRLSPPKILVVGFLFIIAAGTLLLMLPASTVDGSGLSLIDALFTATSATCVTGLVVVDTGSALSLFGQLTILVLIQIGGLGFMTFATFFAILLGRKINLKERMLLQEAYNQTTIEGIVRLAKYILLAALLMEAIAVLILTASWSDDMGFAKALYYAVFHSISAFNNAGFDLFGNSLMDFQNDIVTNITVMFLIILGGIGFVVMSDVYSTTRKRVNLHSWLVLRTSALLIAGGAVLFFLLEFNNPASLGGLELQGKILPSFFQSVTPRTAGFNTLDISGLRDTTKILLMVFMFIGASPGSTGGGIKTTTFVTIILAVRAMLKNKAQVVVRERSIPFEVVRKAAAIAVLGTIWIVLVTALLTITEQEEFMVLLFETVSAFGTVGLTLGVTSSLTIWGKVLIILTMFSGRVGLLTMVYALGNNNNAGDHAKYPESKIMVG